MALAAQDGQAVGLVEGGGAGAHLGVEEAGGHNVDAGELAPLARQGLAKLRDKGLGAVVDGLVDGHVDNVPADARRDDQVAGALALEHLAGVLGAVDDAVN